MMKIIIAAILAILITFGAVYALRAANPPVEPTTTVTISVDQSEDLTEDATAPTEETTEAPTEDPIAPTEASTAAPTTTPTNAPTNAPTTTTTVATPAINLASFNRDDLIAAFAGTSKQYARQVDWLDSLDVPNNRTYTGVRLKDLLEYCGIDVNALPATATITAGTTDNRPVTYTYAEIMDNTTMVAWLEDRGGGDVRDVSRFCHPDSATTGSAGRSAQNVNSLTIN